MRFADECADPLAMRIAQPASWVAPLLIWKDAGDVQIRLWYSGQVCMGESHEGVSRYAWVSHRCQQVCMGES